jgi:hypothetical protein
VFDFPLDSGFPKPFERPDSPDPALTPICDDEIAFGSIGPYADEAVVSSRGESEGRSQRWLIIFKDQDVAKSAMAEARDSLASCTPSGPGSQGVRLVYEEVPVDLGTEDSFAWTEQVERDGDDLVSDLTYSQAARTGNAIYIESTYTSAGGDEVVAQVQQLLTQRSREPLEFLCVYAADPCLDPYATPPSGVDGAGPTTATLVQ